MGSNRTHSSDLLHIPGREKALAELLSNATPAAKISNSNSNSSSPTITPSENRKTSKIEPSDILSRVQAFLPQIQTANQTLSEVESSKLDIENVNDDEQYIEMNLGLGVLEEKRANSDDDDDDEDDDDDSIVISKETETVKTEKPNIEILDNSKEAD